MTAKRVQMEKHTPLPDSDAAVLMRRRAHRRQILGALREICLKIEQLQQSDDARAACREVAHLLQQARQREGSRGSSTRKS